MTETKACTRCEEVLPLDGFYFVSKKLGTRRGQCKDCMREVKHAQRDPGWVPTCSKCGETRERSGMGRRLCQACFDARYTYDDPRVLRSGSLQGHRLRLKDCTSCGAPRERDGHHAAGSSLCHVCRSVPSHRRTSLRNLFNLTPREYLDLLEHQGGSCAICKKKPRKGKGLAVDHRHGLKPSRIIRGLLCNRCNLLISQAQDSPLLLRSAASFLEDPIAQRLFPGREATEEADRNGGLTDWATKRKYAGRK